jgi:RecA-family ATPase
MRRALIVKIEDATAVAYNSPVGADPRTQIDAVLQQLEAVRREAIREPNELIRFADDIEDAPHAPDVYEGTIPQQGVGIGYGGSTLGKTAWAVGLISAVSGGEPFLGRSTLQAPCLYLPLEGAGGINRRFAAARHTCGNTGRRLAIMTEGVVMGRMPGSEQCVGKIVAASRALEAAAGAPLGLIVVDTWHQAIGGDDDNASGTAGAVFGQAREITKATGATLLFLDHPGKDGVLRGSSAKKPGCDFLIRFERAQGSPVTEVFAEKVKDGEEGPRGAFTLQRVELSHGRTSCTVAPCTNPQRRNRSGPHRKAPPEKHSTNSNT